jgi:Holliday junction resolvase RusA-like endonuclease
MPSLPIKLAVTPVSKPRMSQSDRWKSRACTKRYWAFKDQLKALWGNDDLPAAISIKFCIPMPASWSEKKKSLMDGKPHQAKPDIDNLVKSIFDCLAKSDAYIWRVDAVKYWAREGSIEIGNYF